MNVRNKFFIAIIGFVFLIGCSNNKGEEIIDADTFVDVLTDIHLADATLVVKGYRIASDSTLIHLYYNDVFQKHGVTQVQVLNTFRYYTKTPKKFEKIYDRVSEKIVKLEEEFEENTELKSEEELVPKKEKKQRHNKE